MGDRNRQLPGPRWDVHDRGEQTTGENDGIGSREIERAEKIGGESERPVVSRKRGNHPEGPRGEKGTPCHDTVGGKQGPILKSGDCYTNVSHCLKATCVDDNQNWTANFQVRCTIRVKIPLRETFVFPGKMGFFGPPTGAEPTAFLDQTQGNMAGASKPGTVPTKRQWSRRRVRDGALIHSGSRPVASS